MTRRQRQALIHTENEIQKKYRGFAFQVPQGSWRPYTNYSGSSHTGAAVVDLQYYGFYGDVGFSTKAEKEKARFVLRAIREYGHQAAFFRGPWDDMILHFHVCDLDTAGAAETVRYFQVPQYKKGCNGLSLGQKDRFPYRPKPLSKWRFRN